MGKDIISKIDGLSEKRKLEIRSTRDGVEIEGVTYYVSSTGSDDNDGKSPDTPWKSTERVNREPLKPGDGVRFKRGELFRGGINAREGVTYAAYGEGEKPRIYGWVENLASPDLWEIYDGEANIYKYTKKITDCGTLVFNDDECVSRKLIPSYIGGKFVCRDDESRPFDMRGEMTQDLDVFTHYTERLSTEPSKGENFPVPVIDGDSYGELYLRCDRGNPGEVFSSIEAVANTRIVRVAANDNVRVDNLCMKYACFAVSAGGECIRGLTVTNCEIGYVGGNVQHYKGTDPNYPKGKRGTVTRFGNAIEIYGGCDSYTVSDCYIYQSYDAGITHQNTTCGSLVKMTNIVYKNNLIENCVYSVEYFLEKNMGDTESYMDNIEICGNILRLSGYGWGQQRHNVDTPAHIKGWSYENTARNFKIHHNIFDRSAYRMLHLVARDEESLPRMRKNVYVQHLGGSLGQYGANKNEEPPILPFDKSAKGRIKKKLLDKGCKVYTVNS